MLGRTVLVSLLSFSVAGHALAEPSTRAQAVQAADPGSAQASAVRRDPFRQPDIDVVLPPPPSQCGRLCDYDVEQLRVAALVTGMAMPLAGLEAPNGKVYIVDRGTLVGKRGGQVVEVSSSRIVVEEPCKREGKLTRCRITLQMPPAAEPQQEENLLRR